LKKQSFNEFFAPLNNIFYKKQEPYDPRVMPAYLMSLWLSHSNDLLELINDINDIHFLIDDRLIQKYYYHMVPKGRRFLKWIKKDKADENEIDTRKELGISRIEYRWYKELM